MVFSHDNSALGALYLYLGQHEANTMDFMTTGAHAFESVRMTIFSFSARVHRRL